MVIIKNNGRPMQDTAEFRKRRLLDLSAQMQQLSGRRDAQFPVAIRLNVVREEKLYLDGGFKNIYEYAQEVLNIKRITANNYTRIARDFLNPCTERTIFADGRGRDFGYSQLVELLRVDKDSAIQFVKSGQITYTTSARAIKSIVDDFKATQDKSREEAEKAAMEPFQAAHESFHTAYNALKEYLLERGDEHGANVLLPEIMGAVVDLYQEGLKGLNNNAR